MDAIWEARDARERAERKSGRGISYDDMDDGENFIYFATGVPPQRHLDCIGSKFSAKELYKKFLKKLSK